MCTKINRMCFFAILCIPLARHYFKSILYHSTIYSVNINYLIEFFLFSACKVCPDFGRQRLSFGNSCPCEPLYQDRSPNKCVKFLNCPLFEYLYKFKDEKTWDKLEYDEDIATIVRDTVKALDHYEGGNIVGDLFDTQIILGIQQILKIKGIALSFAEIQQSDDFKFLCDCMSNEWDKITNKHSDQVRSIMNPVLMKNKKLEAECQKNKICKFYTVLEKNKAGFSKNLARYVPDMGNSIIDHLDMMKTKSVPFCREHHCQFVKTLLKDTGILKEILTNVIEERQEFTKTLVDIVCSARRTLEMYAGSAYY